jgi:hypothetical protein
MWNATRLYKCKQLSAFMPNVLQIPQVILPAYKSLKSFCPFVQPVLLT